MIMQMQIVTLPLFVIVILLCATCSQSVSAQNISSMNNTNNTNVNGSTKIVVVPPGTKATITTNTSTGQNKNLQSTNRTGFSYVSNLIIKDKTFPIKYNITSGKLLGIVADKDKTTLVFLLGAASDNGKLTLEIPRNVIDSKTQGNTDTKFNVRIDNKGVDYKELGTSLNARILQIGIGKGDRLMELIGTQMAS